MIQSEVEKEKAEAVWAELSAARLANQQARADRDFANRAASEASNALVAAGKRLDTAFAAMDLWTKER